MRIIKHRFMVRLMVANYSDELKEDILGWLRSHFVVYKEYEVSIQLEFIEKYWKFPDLMECIFLVEFKKEIFFLDFIKAFNFDKWQFKDGGPCYDPKKPNDVYLEEEVIWSKNVDKEGVFIDENVEWAHIYTWDY